MTTGMAKAFMAASMAIGTVFSLVGCGGGGIQDRPPKIDLFTTNITFARTVNTGTDIFVVQPAVSGFTTTNVTNSAASRNISPTFSPDGTHIAFVSQRDGHNQIYTMNRDGSDVTRLTSSTAHDTRPSWSPDGTKIAFARLESGHTNIYVVNTDGSSLTQVTPGGHTEDYPTWSPSNLQLAFTSDRSDDGFTHIYKINVDGTDLTRISYAAGAYDSEPSWSRLNKIAFTRSTDAQGAQICTMDTGGSNLTRITGGTVNTGGWHPSWSIDAAKIVYVSDRTGNLRMFWMSGVGNSLGELLIGITNDFDPSWGPDYVSSTIQ